jgi:hypothetical protein
MARPRHLPPFNPLIPEVLRSEFGALLPLAEKAVSLSLSNSSTSGLAWLKLYHNFSNQLHNSKRLESISTISEEERQALLWTKHKGKHNWNHAILASNLQPTQPQPEPNDKGKRRKRTEPTAAAGRVEV